METKGSIFRDRETSKMMMWYPNMIAAAAICSPTMLMAMEVASFSTLRFVSPWNGGCARRTRRTTTTTSTTSGCSGLWALSSSSSQQPQLYEFPLWDKLSQDIIVPLPSSHLPDELTTCSIYGVQIQTPLERIIIEQATSLASLSSKQYFGVAIPKHDEEKENLDDIQVGSIGCACQILIHDEKNQVVLCRGAFRFIVKDIIQRIPFAIVQVQELPDDDEDEPERETTGTTTSIQSIHDDDDEDDYAQLSPNELMQRTLLAVKSCIDRKIQETSSSVSSSSTSLSPLEEAILQDSGKLTDYQLAESAQRQAAQENAAVLEVFQSYLIDDDDLETPQQRWFAVAFLAAELCDFDMADRIYILQLTHTLERLRYVCRVAERIVGFQYAQSIANSITDSVDESSKELKVGTPDLPPWVRQIRKGMQVEYFWNPEHGWCRGVVIQDPVILEEENNNGKKEVPAKMMLCVQFEDDGTTHWLPVLPDEKARWRPA